MAKTVKIDLRDHAGVPAGGAGMRRDRVTVWAPTFRPATGGDWTVGPQPVEYFFEDGLVSIPNVDAGPLVVRFDVDQMDGTDTFTVTVPPGDGVVTMRELLADEYEYAPIVISEARRVLSEARDLLGRSESAASAAKASEGAAASSASAAKASQSAAAGSASEAKASEGAAASSASAAAASQGQAKESATAAQNAASEAASSAAAAKSSQGAAAGSASEAKAAAAAAKSSQNAAAASEATAKEQAGVAKKEADRATQKATEVANTVEGNYSPVGHKHALGDVNNLLDALSEITLSLQDKAPKSHKHEVEDVNGLQVRLTGIDSAVAGKAAKADLAGVQGKIFHATIAGNKIATVVNTPGASAQIGWAGFDTLGLALVLVLIEDEGGGYISVNGKENVYHPTGMSIVTAPKGWNVVRADKAQVIAIPL